MHACMYVHIYVCMRYVCKDEFSACKDSFVSSVCLFSFSIAAKSRNYIYFLSIKKISLTFFHCPFACVRLLLTQVSCHNTTALYTARPAHHEKEQGIMKLCSMTAQVPAEEDRVAKYVAGPLPPRRNCPLYQHCVSMSLRQFQHVTSSFISLHQPDISTGGDMNATQSQSTAATQCLAILSTLHANGLRGEGQTRVQRQQVCVQPAAHHLLYTPAHTSR